jgi:DNA-directed RNA polymerase specialized sigma24 family protein
MAVTSRAFPGLLSDPQAFTELYERALPRVYGYLRARCAGEAWLAEDLTQETFLAAVAEIKRGRLITVHGLLSFPNRIELTARPG